METLIMLGLFLLPAPAVATTTLEILPVEKSIEQRVTEAYNDPRMVAVLKCESGLRQLRSDGTPIISPTSDVGISQINQVHWKRAKELGLDIFNSEMDNLKMGKMIYDTQGIEAWTCSKLI